MQISIGMALVRGAGALISYLLRDEFITNRAAGAVNGTAAEPGPGVRVATAGNVAISSGEIVVTGTGVWGEAGWYLSPATNRLAGLLLKIKIKLTSGANTWMAGFTSTTDFGFAGFAHAALTGATGLVIAMRGNSAATSLVIFTAAANTSYDFALLQRATGLHVFMKSGANWILLCPHPSGSGGPLSPGVSVNTGTHSVASDFMRLFASNWLPTPLCSDGFASAFGVSDGLGHAETTGIGAGGSGLTWTGATWSVSGAKAINTPGLGSELLTNTEFATDTTGWSALNGATLTRRDFTSSPDIDPTGGSDNFGLEVASGGLNSSAARQAPTLVTGAWYQVQARLFSPSGNTAVNAALLAAVNPAAEVKVAPVEDAWQAILVSGRATGTTGDVRLRCLSSTAGDKAYFDAPSLKVLTLADLFASVSVSTADVVADVNVVVTAGTQAGLVLNLDSTSSPANFIIAYHDGTNCKLEKCVAGVYTTVITAAATYSAGATLRVTKIGTAYRLYYNSALVGSGTISDAGIISNLRAGLFSTYDQNSLDNFVLYASGSEGQYAILDSY